MISSHRSTLDKLVLAFLLLAILLNLCHASQDTSEDGHLQQEQYDSINIDPQSFQSAEAHIVDPAGESQESQSGSSSHSFVDDLPKSEYIHTVATATKGLAVFARKSIPAGSAIIIEEPLLTIPVPEMVPGKGFRMDDMEKSISSAFAVLTPAQQTTYTRLHNHRFDFETPDSSKDEDRRSTSHLMSIFRTNANINYEKIGIFPKIARINHSCRPNAGNAWSDSRNARVIYAYRDIEEGEEITVSYIPLIKSKKERNQRLEQYGFECTCEACALDAEKSKESDKNRWRISEGLEDLTTKVGDGKERKPETWDKMLQKAEKLYALVLKEEIWDYQFEIAELATKIAKKANDEKMERRWNMKADTILQWRQGMEI